MTNDLSIIMFFLFFNLMYFVANGLSWKNTAFKAILFVRQIRTWLFSKCIISIHKNTIIRKIAGFFI